MYNSETNFGIVELKEVEMLFNESNFIESEQQSNDQKLLNMSGKKQIKTVQEIKDMQIIVNYR